MAIYQGRQVTLADGPGDGSAHEVNVNGVPYAIPAGHVGVILDDGRVIAADPQLLRGAILQYASGRLEDAAPAPKATPKSAPAPKARKRH